LKTPSSLLTVVTVVYNARQDFLTTLASIREQTARADFEYLVVDGGSIDGTVDEIRAAADRGEVDSWVSEPDRGIYDAMNKAIGLAGGQWVLFMNSADVFVSPSSVADSRLADVTTGLAYGHCEQVYPDGGVHLTRCRDFETTLVAMPCSHQSLFARRDLLVRFPFDLRYRVAADHHFLARCLGAGVTATKWDRTIARVRLEHYSWKQLQSGQRQKCEAMLDAGAPPAIRSVYWRQTAALGVKHLLKKLAPASWWRRTWRT
jgi:glycosyltransferase involved in cell wall biosynthesis